MSLNGIESWGVKDLERVLVKGSRGLDSEHVGVGCEIFVNRLQLSVDLVRHLLEPLPAILGAGNLGNLGVIGQLCGKPLDLTPAPGDFIEQLLMGGDDLARRPGVVAAVGFQACGQVRVRGREVANGVVWLSA